MQETCNLGYKNQHECSMAKYLLL